MNQFDLAKKVILMYKIKTKKSIRKRLKSTSKGLFKCKHSGIRHRLTSKSSNKNRRCYSFNTINSSDLIRIKKYVHLFIK